MFVDEETELFLRNSSQLDINKKLGLWRTVVVHNLPYADPRRNGKVISIYSSSPFKSSYIVVYGYAVYCIYLQ